MRDLENIISELEQQKAAIERALAALREVAQPGPRTRSAVTKRGPGRPPKKRSRMTDEGRQRLAESMKKQWAVKKAAKRAAKKAAPER